MFTWRGVRRCADVPGTDLRHAVRVSESTYQGVIAIAARHGVSRKRALESVLGPSFTGNNA